MFDRENKTVAREIVSANTVVLDNNLMKPKNKAKLRFSGSHKGSHVLLHSDVDLKALNGS